MIAHTGPAACKTRIRSQTPDTAGGSQAAASGDTVRAAATVVNKRENSSKSVRVGG